MAQGKIILQIALDFIDIDRALAMAKEAVAGGVDWIEVGTPLIKAVGLESVRTLRREFPQKFIVADMKVMDAGRTEVECAAKSGANLVTVLAAASDRTIKECVEAAGEYGVKIACDLINTPNPDVRAKELEVIGVDYIDVHTPIDAQMEGDSPFETLKKVRGATSLPICVAGGVSLSNAEEVIALGGNVLIVGGAITKSKDAKRAAEEFVGVISGKTAPKTTDFKRANEDNILDILSQVSVANVSDAMFHGGVLEGIKPLVPCMRCAGRVLTVRTAPGDWAKPVIAIDEANEGDILVIDAGGSTPAIWGELATTSAISKKLGGTIIFGAIRDTNENRELGYPLFSTKTCPNAGEPKGYGEIGSRLLIKGVHIKTGDYAIADNDGVAIIPAENAVNITNKAMSILENENRLRAEIQIGSTLATVAKLTTWEKR